MGLIFDGNLQSLVGDYLFTDEQARAIAVHPAAMIEALDKVYHADHLVAEILGTN
ncbi:Peptidase S46 [compost metagenome]